MFDVVYQVAEVMGQPSVHVATFSWAQGGRYLPPRLPTRAELQQQADCLRRRGCTKEADLIEDRLYRG